MLSCQVFQQFSFCDCSWRYFTQMTKHLVLNNRPTSVQTLSVLVAFPTILRCKVIFIVLLNQLFCNQAILPKECCVCIFEISSRKLPPPSYYNASGRAYPDLCSFSEDVLIVLDGEDFPGNSSKYISQYLFICFRSQELHVLLQWYRGLCM